MKAVLFLILCCWFTATTSQSLQRLQAQADSLEAAPNEKAAFNVFKLIHQNYQTNLYAVTKCSELSSRIGSRESDTRSRDNYYAAALAYAKKALAIDPNDDEANVAMSIALGRTTMYKSGREKVSAAREIRRHAEIALNKNPANFKAWHIMGKWHFEVSNLNMFERAALRVFYGGIPEASLSESIRAYEKAKRLKPDFLLNYLELAKAYKRNEEDKKALAVLQSIFAYQPRSEDDPRIIKEAHALISKWK